MTKSKHDQIAEFLAKKLGTEYKSDKGVDLVTKNAVIEVEAKKSGLEQGIKQVSHSFKPRYLAVSDEIIKLALEMTKSTGIGIRNERGKIVKRAGRRH